MKKIYSGAFLMITIFLAGCSALSPQDPVRSFIPGKYFRTVSNEFSVGKDTLEIAVISIEGNSYKIMRKTTFQRITDNKPLLKESKQENWTAVYNEQEKILHETQKGKLITFNPENRSLSVGTSEYKKID